MNIWKCYFFRYWRCLALDVYHFNPLTATESCCFGIDNQLCSGKPELFGIGNQLCSGEPRYLTWCEGKVRIWVNSCRIPRYCDQCIAENPELLEYRHIKHFTSRIMLEKILDMRKLLCRVCNNTNYYWWQSYCIPNMFQIYYYVFKWGFMKYIGTFTWHTWIFWDTNDKNTALRQFIFFSLSFTEYNLIL